MEIKIISASLNYFSLFSFASIEMFPHILCRLDMWRSDRLSSSIHALISDERIQLIILALVDAVALFSSSH